MYTLSLVGKWALAISSTLMLQEMLKVAVITTVSPQFLPSIRVVRGNRVREAMRMAVRAVLGALYATASAL